MKPADNGCRCDDDVLIDGESRSVYCPVHDDPNRVHPTWLADVIVRCLLIVIAVGAGAAIRTNFHTPEMFALGGVAAIMALIGERSWRA